MSYTPYMVYTIKFTSFSNYCHGVGLLVTNIKTVKKSTCLSNGVVVATEEIPGVYSGSIGVWLDIGSRDETVATNGVSHLFEHMAFKGTVTRSGLEIVKTLEAAGGQINAFTTKEHTCFYAKVMGPKTPLALEILTEMVFQPALKKQELSKEKEVIIEELRGCDDNPDERVYDLFGEALFSNQKLGFPIAGTVKSVSALSQETLLAHAKKIRERVPVYIVAVGNVSHSEVISIVKRMTRHIKVGVSNRTKTKTIPQRIIKRSKVLYSHSSILEKKDIHQANLMLGGPSFAVDNKKCFPLIILNNILGDGMSSRLFQKLREDYGCVYHINTYSEALMHAGLFGISFSTEPKHLVETLKLISGELKALKQEGISEDELEFAIENLSGSFLLDMESTQSRMTFLARLKMRSGIINSPQRYLKALKNVTRTEVQDVIHEVLDSRKWAIAAVLPKGKCPSLKKYLDF
ncbi:MAG: insulinase family protein [Fibrobacteria bacterium]|nr:insulinase family protein [Fibrobacteria bacterium]